MTLKSDKHNNYDVHNMLQCQILHQSGVIYFYSELRILVLLYHLILVPIQN